MTRYFSLWCILAIISTNAQGISKEKKEFDAIYDSVSNRNKWGPSDELGTLNYISTTEILNALKIPTEGIKVSLAFNLEKEPSTINPHPFEHQLFLSRPSKTYRWNSDYFGVNYHGLAHSHMDALSHLSHNGKFYNDFPEETINKTQGATKLGIENISNGIMGRGVLIDVPSIRGIEFVPAGTPIYTADILAFEKKHNIQLKKGDILFIRTGRQAEVKAKDLWPFSEKKAGLHYTVVTLLHQRKIALMGADGTNEFHPSPIKEEQSPIHKITITAMGMPLLDNLNLEELYQTASKLNRWTFLITINPLRVKGGTGSPVNPIAVF